MLKIASDKITRLLQRWYITYVVRSTRRTRLSNGWSPNSRLVYHAYNIKDLKWSGQRNCERRLEAFDATSSLSAARVLDIGSSLGGILLHSNHLSAGMGIDADWRSIRASRLIAHYLARSPAISFRQLDLNERRGIEHLEQILDTFQPTHVFMLSMGSWLND